MRQKKTGDKTVTNKKKVKPKNKIKKVDNSKRDPNDYARYP